MADAVTNKISKSNEKTENELGNVNEKGGKVNNFVQIEEKEDVIQELRAQIQTVLENQNKMMTSNESNINAMMEKLEKMEVDYSNTMKSINKVEENYSILKKTVDGVLEFQGFINEKYEDQKKQITSLEKQLKNIINQNKELNSKNIEQNNIINSMKTDITKGKQNTNDLQQYVRREMIDIAGVPRTRNEDTDKIVIAVAGLMGLTITNYDIAISHRVSTKPKAPIIVKFVSRRLRNLMFDRRKQLKNFRVKDLKVAGNCHQKIYINESLTPENAIIFKKTKQTLNSVYKYIWTHNGITFVKENDDSVKTFVRSLSDVKKLQTKHNIEVVDEVDEEVIINIKHLVANNDNDQ